MKYPIAIERGDETHAWGVVVPDLPGCFAAGDTLDEAYEMAREAMSTWINAALDDGREIPAPSSVESCVKAAEFDGWMWGVVDLDPGDFDDTIQRINISVPTRILKQIDRSAAKRHLSRSSFLAISALHFSNTPLEPTHGGESSARD